MQPTAAVQCAFGAVQKFNAASAAVQCGFATVQEFNVASPRLFLEVLIVLATAPGAAPAEAVGDE